MKKIIRLTESDLHRIIKESVGQVIEESGYGSTPQGNFALNAVRGRRAAKRYYTNMNLKDRAENDRVIGMAGDKTYQNYQENPKLGISNEAGYRYGFQKGIEKYNPNRQ